MAELASLSKNQNKKVGFIHYKGKILSRYNMSGEENSEFMEALNEKLIGEIHEEIRILYVAMTRAKQHIVLTGKEEEYDGDFKLCEENIVENINTYEKMIKYSTGEGRADLDTIAFISSDDLQQIQVQHHNVIEEEIINEADIRKRILYKPQIKPRVYASASKYMSYSSCPRKYYYENILGGRYVEYTNIQEVKLQEKELDIESGLDITKLLEDSSENNKLGIEENIPDGLIKENIIKATDKGVLVHKVLERMNKQGNENYETYIQDIIDDDFLEDEIKTFVNNYLAIEEKENSERTYGEIINSSSEVSYLLAPLPDKKMMINGFIDKLKLYLLQTGEVVSIEYEEDKVTKLMKTMDEGFYKMNTAVSLDDYEKVLSGNCSWCKYREGCLK